MSNLLTRLEKVEELMNPPEGPKLRIEVVFINPVGTVAGRRITGSNGEDEKDES